MADDATSWIYHERQQAALCGLHSINNLCQGPAFTTTQLNHFAQELDEIELAMYGPPGSPAYMARLAEGSGNRDPSGNFSIQVLQRALGSLPSRIELPNMVDERVRNVEPTDFEGFICHKADHWFAIRKIGDRFWNLNSFLAKPESIGHFKLATEIANVKSKGYTVFVALPENWRTTGKLPAVTARRSELEKSKLKYFWNANILVEDERKVHHKGEINSTNTAAFSFDDVNKTEIKDRANATQDPWLEVGSGATLGSKIETNVVPFEAYNSLEVNFLDKSDANAIKVQIRLPQNKRAVKVFDKTQSIAHVYKAVFDLCTKKPPGKRLQLRAGYPPKVLADGSVIIGDAKLKGASITCHWI